MIGSSTKTPAIKKGHPFMRGDDWYIMSGGREVRLLDLAPTLEREALRDPEFVAARRRAAGMQEDEWPDNALDSF